jgi:CRISPR-associated protein Cas2
MSRAARPELAWLLCYDMTDPRRRRRMARLLEGAAVRLQRSVFVAECTPHEAQRLHRRGERLLRAGDDLRLYALAQRMPQPLPWRARPISAMPDYWLL